MEFETLEKQTAGFINARKIGKRWFERAEEEIRYSIYWRLISIPLAVEMYLKIELKPQLNCLRLFF